MDAFQAAAANADFTKVQDFYLILTDQPGDKSWPITAATYMLLRKDYPAGSEPSGAQVPRLGPEKRPGPCQALDYVPAA